MQKVDIIWPKLRRGFDLVSTDQVITLEPNVIAVTLENIGVTALLINKVVPIAVGGAAIEFDGAISGNVKDGLIVTRTIDSFGITFTGGAGSLLVFKTYFEGVDITECNY